MISGLMLGLLRSMAQAPVADFSATPTSGCGPLNVQFKDISTNSPTTWSWDFGDGSTDSRQNPLHTYASVGTYTVTLIARNGNGADAMRKNGYITVYPSPTPGFSVNLNLACAPAQIQYTDNSSAGQGSITAWKWDLGDGTTTNQQNPAHTYTQTGYYTVSLTVTNSGGCSNSVGVTRYLRVVPGIQPNFTFDQSSTACSAPFNGQLLNQSAGPGNLTFNWTMDNGAIPSNSTDTSPLISFPNSGQYDVTLQVASSLGCSASLKKTLPFSNNGTVLNGPTTICVNSPVTYSDGSTPLPSGINWDFGDGTTSTAPTVSKTFTSTGSYNVKLVNHYTSCADSTTETVQVVLPPVAAFSVTPSPAAACQPPLTVNFSDQSTGSPTSWQWDFGDGSTSTSQSPSHSYSALGTYNVKLTVTGAGGCSNTITQNAIVKLQAPTVTIAGNLNACVSGTGAVNTITPSADVTLVDNVTQYAWTAPGSNEGSSNSPNPTFTYNSIGNYTLNLTITTSGGCTAKASTTVQISTATPVTFTANPQTVCGNDPVTFATSSTPADQWHWDFGDNSNSGTVNQSTISHTYLAPGTYPVTLTLTNGGCPNTYRLNETVNPAVPNFGWKVNCPLAVDFLDSSLLAGTTPTSYTWDFGDGSPVEVVTSTPWLPATHNYTASGPYTITLTIVDGSCVNKKTKTLILGSVSPSFTGPTQACRNQPFTLTSTTTAFPNASIIAEYDWILGANAYAYNGVVWQPNIPTFGTYPILLNVKDINGCIYSSPVSNITIAGPIAQFATPAGNGGCKNSLITFTDETTSYAGAPSPIQTWKMDFGDGASQTFTAPPITHTYADTGNVTVSLQAIDANGCADTYTQPLQLTSPAVNFSGPDSFYCPGVPLTFTDSSKGYNLTETWIFGDGNQSTLPVNNYAANGNYNVTLTVVDKYNCSATITKPVRIQAPIAAFDISDTTAICTPLQTNFVAHSQYYDSLYWEFGDTTSSTLPVTSHFYNFYGIDTARLFVRGPGGCLDSASRRVLIQNPYTISNLTYSPLNGCDSVPVQFDITTPPYTRFTTEFGDYSADSSQNTQPFHTYRNPASYNPFLSLSDSTGCIVAIGSTDGAITVLGATPFFSLDKKAFCDSGTVAFTDYTISNDGLNTETYNFGDGSSPQSQNPGSGSFNLSHFYNQIGQFQATLKAATNSGCSEIYTDTIRVYQTPHPLITIPPVTCTGLIQLQGSISAMQVDSILWNWNFGNGQTSKLQDPTVRMTPGNYIITLKTATSFGCTDTTSAAITVHPLPEITGPKEITTPVGIPIAIPFTYSAGLVSYNWLPAANLDCPTCPNPTATIIFNTTYSVTVTDANNCTATDSILIKTICNADNYFFPNTFSPNGDGVNDDFYPRGKSLYNIQSLTIFNRWGQMVFQRRDFPANAANMGWDGNFGGHPAPADAYVYIAEVVCDNAQVVVLHGNVTLLR